MTDKDLEIIKDYGAPVILVSDSPEYPKACVISLKKDLSLQEKLVYDQEEEGYMKGEAGMGVEKKEKAKKAQEMKEMKEMKEIDEMEGIDDELIVEISSTLSSSSVDIIDCQMKEDETEYWDVKGEFCKNTKSILCTIDEFSMDVMKKSMGMNMECNSKRSEELYNIEEEERLGKVVKIDQKVLENTRKRVEKKRVSALKSVNKLKTSKKECIKEMIVNIDRNILSSSMGSILSGLLEGASCEYVEWSSPIPNLIYWKRKVIAEYSESQGYFVPIPETIQPEKFILIYTKASELLEQESETYVDELVKKLRDEFPELKIIFIIESIDALLKKVKNNRNKRYVDAMRAVIETKNSENIFIPSEETEEKIENILLRLQLIHNVFIVNTSSVENSAEWIFILTGDISTIPYKKMKLELSTSFCMESGQIKTGSDVKDTYTKLLQTIYKVTPQIADAIVEKYSKISDLVYAFRENGPDALSDLTIGKLTKRKIGGVLSKRIFHVFMTSDSTASAI